MAHGTRKPRTASIGIAFLVAIAMSVGVRAVTLVAQSRNVIPPSGLRAIDRNSKVTHPPHVWHAPVVSTTPLQAVPESDEQWPELTMKTLSDGTNVVEGRMAGPSPSHVRGRRETHKRYFLFVDSQQHNYRVFKLNGPTESDPRVVDYVRSQYMKQGLDWDALRSRALAARKARTQIRPMRPDLSAKMRQPKYRIRRAAALQWGDTWECFGSGNGSITTRDPAFLELAYSEVGAYVDEGYDNYGGDWWNGWAWWNELAVAPTSLGTNWYFDNSSSTLSFGTDTWNGAWAAFDAIFYNDDFPTVFGLPPARTIVEHYQEADAASGWGYGIAAPTALAGYTGFLHFDVNYDSTEWCVVP